MPSIFLLNGLLKGLLNDASTLVEMTEQSYESEGLLQKLLADNSGVLAGDQFEGAEPKRLLLICQEAGVPEKDAGIDRWSLDHLFVDQNGIPTLVEVKRSTDSRIRREVVGQMFDYAANAVVYWPESQIRTRYEDGCERRGEDPDRRLAEFLRLADDLDSQEVVKQFSRSGRHDTGLPSSVRRHKRRPSGRAKPARQGNGISILSSKLSAYAKVSRYAGSLRNS